MNLICKFASAEFIKSVKILHIVCIWITDYPVAQGGSLLSYESCHQS